MQQRSKLKLFFIASVVLMGCSAPKSKPVEPAQSVDPVDPDPADPEPAKSAPAPVEPAKPKLAAPAKPAPSPAPTAKVNFRKGLEAHHAKVQLGWTEAQVLEHLGKPDKRVGDEWQYLWESTPTKKSFMIWTSTFVYEFEQGRLTLKKMGQGSKRNPDYRRRRRPRKSP